MTKTRKSTIPADLLATPAQAAATSRGPELPAVPQVLAPRRQQAAAEGGIKANTTGTTVYLLPDEAKRLKMLALSTDRSLHDLILDGIDRVLAEAGQPPLRRYGSR